jgi:hypothetical protein
VAVGEAERFNGPGNGRHIPPVHGHVDIVRQPCRHGVSFGYMQEDGHASDHSIFDAGLRQRNW